MLADGKVRWCSGCAQGHVGAMNITHKKCEGCRKRPTFALPAEGKERWCAGCAKRHVGAVDVVHTNCEVCGKKQARHALPSDEKKRRWCGDCAPKAALPRQKPVAWEAQLALLAGYKAAHGDCSVPRGWAEDKQLATWVMTQRKLKRDLDRGQPSGRMTAAWAARLTTLGFVWDTAAARAEAVKEAHTAAKAKVVEEAKAAAAAKDHRRTQAIFGRQWQAKVAAAAASNRSAAPKIAVLADLAGRQRLIQRLIRLLIWRRGACTTPGCGTTASDCRSHSPGSARDWNPPLVALSGAAPLQSVVFP